MVTLVASVCIAVLIQRANPAVNQYNEQIIVQDVGMKFIFYLYLFVS